MSRVANVVFRGRGSSAQYLGRRVEKDKMERDFNEAVQLQPKYRFLGFQDLGWAPIRLAE
jgi:hypothetical protein